MTYSLMFYIVKYPIASSRIPHARSPENKHCRPGHYSVMVTEESTKMFKYYLSKNYQRNITDAFYLKGQFSLWSIFWRWKKDNYSALCLLWVLFIQYENCLLSLSDCYFFFSWFDIPLHILISIDLFNLTKEVRRATY